MKLPCVRFIRSYDVSADRMVNVWERITTQDQLENEPRAVELTVTAPTFDEAMVEIEKSAKYLGIGTDTLVAIKAAIADVRNAQPSSYGVIKPNG